MNAKEANELIEKTVANAPNKNVPHWYAQLWCENRKCDLRDIIIHVKEHPGDPPFARAPFVCPACRQTANFHWVRDSYAQSDIDKYEARCSVNLQRYRRDHPEEIAIPLDKLDDGTLPD